MTFNKLESTDLLSAGVFAGCLGHAINALSWGSRVNSWLFNEHGSSEYFAASVDHIAAAMLLASAVMVWFKRFRVAGLTLSIWISLNILASLHLNIWHKELIPTASATALIAPVALLLLKNRKLAEWLLRVIIALTFATHGLEAILSKRQFVDYILDFWSWFGVGVRESTALVQLHAIGLLDLIVAAMILVPHKMRRTALWMAFWGFVTALMRILYTGLNNFPEFLVRLSHVTVPLALLVIWRAKQKTDNNGN
ncbi:MAG: hypothetical protein L3J82_10545 [Planctomycetes bacterium]|nr:hypothetical protein [Planctomycetota bacterium]